MWLRFLQVLLLLHTTGILMPAAFARPNQVRPRRIVSARAAVELPFITNRTCRAGSIRLTLTNWGTIGSQSRGLNDPCTRLPAPSCESPRNSGIEYLFQGGLWIGGVRGRDTLVSVGVDGWQTGLSELFPAPFPEGEIIERTTRDSLPLPRGAICDIVRRSNQAVSEHDIIAVFTDTVTNVDLTGFDGIDGRPHKPLGIKVTQSSYAWSSGFAKDFVIIDYQFENIGGDLLRDLFIGQFMDHDVGSFAEDGSFEDDHAGFIHSRPVIDLPQALDTLSIAWIADNDGDPRAGFFDQFSATGVGATSIIRTPVPQPAVSFNWWLSNTTASRDWGPNDRHTNCLGWYPFGNLGTPEGDRSKYCMLSNGERDYDQMDAAVDHSAEGWLPPISGNIDVTNGDTKYMLSVGPFDLMPGESAPLTLAVMVAPEFHTDPGSYSAFFDAGNTGPYRASLGFDNLIRTARWAKWMYDTPGLDTDGNGYRGLFGLSGKDTIWYAGDGVPDFQGPPPPPSPELLVSADSGTLFVRWNGERTETERDIFLRKADFEGYRVYLSRTNLARDFAMLAQRDLIDYTTRAWDEANLRWSPRGHPLTLDSLLQLYSDLDSTLGFPFHPDSFPVADLSRALLLEEINPRDPAVVDSVYVYFDPFGGNLAVDDKHVLHTDSSGLNIARIIYKPFPDALPDDIAYRDDGTPFKPYYEYQYELDGMYMAEPVYIAVTAFDFGDPFSELESQESYLFNNVQNVHPGFLAASAGTDRPKPGLFPNPYHKRDDYRGSGWEPPARREPDPERARRITFYNLPDTCTIQIWSLDGDLVRVLNHAEPSGSANASFHTWNVLTRNTQKVTTGLYIWAVESRYGTDVGKLAVIR